MGARSPPAGQDPGRGSTWPGESWVADQGQSTDGPAASGLPQCTVEGEGPETAGKGCGGGRVLEIEGLTASLG